MHSPDAHAIVSGRYRRALLRKFPYAVFYSYDNGIITIFAVLHNGTRSGDLERETVLICPLPLQAPANKCAVPLASRPGSE